MREIKFRAWDNEHAQWRYGWLTKLVEGVRKFWAIIQDEDNGLVRYYIHDDKSIGQYTGLKDKNGKEIYEGDVVYEILHPGNEEYQHVVEDIRKLPIHEEKHDYPYQEWEVIGNIYENPELLK